MAQQDHKPDEPNDRDELLYERQDGIGWATFNRPKARNALTFAMYDRLAEICRSAAGDPALKVLVVTGAGDRAFAAGTDISLFRDFSTEADGLAYEERMETVLRDIENCPIPTIAAISGACTGGGAAIAAVCDIRIATRSMRFGVPIARTLGNCLSAANLIRFSSLLGPARTQELLLTARLIEAEEAHAIGLVSEVVDSHEALLAQARDLAGRLVTHAPLTMSITKEMFRRIRQSRPVVDDADLIARSYTSEDFREGLDAFLSKRRPAWKGR